MNKLCYRLVFNQARGMLMAVQETARSQGKGPGETRAAAGMQGMDGPPLRRLALLLGTAFGGALWCGAALAQIVADPNAPGQQQATVLRTANGVLQVNVQTPSAAGVSRNVYSQFDVPHSGAILNNARTDVQTQLGGWVQANPWMKEGSARVILNEVNSSNPSRLQGFIEVAGPRAETVIANPAGIVVDGGGFINVSRATLSTGAPQMVDGRLTGFDVQRGVIAIEGAGLNASQTDYTALIARSVQLNAGLWAQRLDVVAGVNQVGLGDEPEAAPVVTPAGASHTGAPSYAIDVARLGGMYANHIWLVGTEAGVGVRNAGEIGAAAGDLVVTSSGRLENRGTMEAKQRLDAQAQAIENAGDMLAGAGLLLTAQELRNAGELATHGEARIALEGAFDNRMGTLEAERLEIAAATLVNRDGSIVQTGGMALGLEAQAVSNGAGTLGRAAAAPSTASPAAPVGADTPADAGAATPPAAPESAPGVDAATAQIVPEAPTPTPMPAPVVADGSLKADLLDNDGGRIEASGGVGVRTGQFLNLGGEAHLENLEVRGPRFNNAGGTLQVRDALQVETDSFGNRAGNLLVGGAADVAAGGFDNVDGLLQAGRLALQAATLDNGGGMLRHLGAAPAAITVDGELKQQAGAIHTASALDLRAGSISGARGTLNVTGDLDLTSGDASAAHGVWRIGGDARIATGKLDASEGIVSAEGALALASTSIDNSGGRIVAGTQAAVQVDGAIDNSRGLIQADSALALTAGGRLLNRAGTVETLGEHATLALQAASIDNTSGRLVNTGDGAARIAAGVITSDGLIGGNGSLDIVAVRLANEGKGRIVSAADMTLAVDALLTNRGSIASGAALAVSGARAELDNQGSILAQDDLVIDNGAIVNRGTIATASGGAGALLVDTGRLDNDGGALQAAANAHIEVDGSVSNVQGVIDAASELRLKAGGNLDNAGGDIVGGQRIDVAARNIDNLDGRIVSTGHGDSVVKAAGTIDNGGSIGARGALTVEARVLENRAGADIAAHGALDLGVSEHLVNDGAISSGGAMTYDEGGALLENRGTITAGGDMRMRVDAIDNQGGAILTLDGADMALAANTLDNRGGRVMAGDAARFDIAGEMNNDGGLVQAGDALRVRVGGKLSNAAGTIEVLGEHGTLAIDAGAIDNIAGRIVNAGSGDSSVRAATTLDNSGLIAGNGKLAVEAHDVRNSADGVIAAGAALELTLHGSLDNAGTISSRAMLDMEAAAADVRNRGVIVAGDDATLIVGRLDNDGGRIVTALDSGASLALQAGSLSNRGGAIMAEDAMAVQVTEGFDNTGGTLQAVKRMDVAVGATLSNDAGLIEASGPESTLALQAGAIANGGGRIVNVGAGAASVSGDAIVNNGLIAGNGTLDLAAGTLLNEEEGTIASSGAMQVDIGTAMDNRGAVNSGATLDIGAQDAVVRNSGLVVARGDLAMQGGELNNDGGQIATASGSGAALRIEADGISNRKGVILSDADATIASSGAIDNREGTLQAAGSLALDAAGKIDNDAGVIEALDPAATLALRAGELDNGSGRLVNVGAGDTTLAADRISNRGLMAGNGQVMVAAANIDNAGTIAAGRGLEIDASASIVNAGMVSSHDALVVRAATASLRNSGQIVSGADATLDTGAFENSGQLVTTTEGGGDIALRTGDVVNAGGAIVAAGAMRIDTDGTLDNSKGTIRAREALQVGVSGSLLNQHGAIEATDGAATLDMSAQAIDNGNGRLVNAGSGATRIEAATAIVNSGLVAGNGRLDLLAQTVDNRAAGTLASGGAMDLQVTQLLDNAGSISSAGTLDMDQTSARIANRGKIVAGERLALHADAIVNDGGQIATADGADIALDSVTQLSNRGGQIAAAGNASLAAGGAIDNSGGQVQTPGRLAVSAGGALVNTGGAFEATGTASTLDMDAGSISNSGRIVNSGAGLTDVRSLAGIVNSGTIGGNGALDLAGLTLDNSASGTIIAGAGLELAIRQRLDNAGGTISSGGTLRFNQAGAAFINSGRLGAGGAIDIRAADIDNGGGQLYTASGSGADIALQAGELSNIGGKVAADGRLDVDVRGGVDNHAGTLHGSRGLALEAGRDIANGSGTIEAASGALEVRAASIASSGRIVNGGAGDTRITGSSSIVNDGTIAGNGALTLGTQSLRNGAGGQIGAGRAMLLEASREFTNAGSVSSAGTLTFEQSGASFVNSGQVDAGGHANFKVNTFNNDGGRISTVKNSGADVVVTASGLSNRNGAILADGKASLALEGALDNRGGTLQAGSELSATAKGALNNDGGTIETIGANAVLSIDSVAIDNGGGRIANLGTGDTKLTSQAGILNNGTIAAMGNLLFTGQELQNGAAGVIASGANTLLAIERQWTNQGKVNSGGTLTFDQAGATFVNSGQVLAGGNVVINARQVNNNGGQLGTGNGSGADLALTTEQMSNEGGRIATDRDLAVTTGAMAGMGQLFGGRDLALTMDGDYVHGSGDQQFQSNRDLSLTVTGNITNTANFQAIGTLTLSGQQVTNNAGATIGGQGVAIKASGDLDNAGEIQGDAKLDIEAANVRNTNAIIGGEVSIDTGNLDNTGGQALVGATRSLDLSVSGALNNTGGATLYSSGSLSIGGIGGGAAGLVNNHSSTIEAGGDLAMNVDTLKNIRENVRIHQVETVNDTFQMSLPGWYSHGDNHDGFETGAANYVPREVYFVDQSDILEETPYVTPDGYTVIRAVIRTHANDSVFYVAASGLHTAYGMQERLSSSDGTQVIYYFSKDAMANPDQGGASNNVKAGLTTVTKWENEVEFSSDYGNCSSRCVRLITQPDYHDPSSTLLRDQLKSLAPVKDKLEVRRDAHHTAVEDQIAPGSGPLSQILSGGNMRLTVNSTLDNQYGDIKARGRLDILGTSDIRNEGATLYRKHTFNGYWYTAAGDRVAYSHPSLSEEIGSAAGTIKGEQGVSITGRSFTNVDVTAGTAGNIRDSVQVLGSGHSGAGSAGAQATTGRGSGGVEGGVRGGASHAGVDINGAQAASGGVSGLGASAASGASGVQNGLAAGGTADASGAGHDLAAQGDANASGARNDGRIMSVSGNNQARIGVGDVRSSGGAGAVQGATGVQGAGVAGARQVAAGGLFIQNPDASGDYLFEARPQFANQGQWTSSDYLLNQIGMDPNATHKRLGDGFYEQRLVREQLSELTGHSSSGASDDSVYKELLTNGASAAHEFGLRPGIGLSADQVAHLTSDIVWMVSENVQLPDGSVETVLVPKVYVAHAGKDAVKAGGALVTGDGVSINVTESIANLGGVIDGGSGRTVLVAGRDIVNSGGTIAGGSVGIKAGGDVRN